MNLLLDQDVWEATAQFLANRGDDVLRVAEIGLATADDEVLLHVAQERERIFITRDSDFGGLVFVRKLGAGVIYLRILPSTQRAVHQELANILQKYTADQLSRAFIAVTPGGHRFRRISA